MKRISTLILAVFMVCGLFCVSSAAADTEQWWEQDVWSTDVLVSLGAVLPDYDPASDTPRRSSFCICQGCGSRKTPTATTPPTRPAAALTC